MAGETDSMRRSQRDCHSFLDHLIVLPHSSGGGTALTQEPNDGLSDIGVTEISW